MARRCQVVFSNSSLLPLCLLTRTQISGFQWTIFSPVPRVEGATEPEASAHHPALKNTCRSEGHVSKSFVFKKHKNWDFPGASVLESTLPLQGAQVRSLLRELRSCMLSDALPNCPQKQKKKKTHKKPTKTI